MDDKERKDMKVPEQMISGAKRESRPCIFKKNGYCQGQARLKYRSCRGNELQIGVATIDCVYYSNSVESIKKK